MFIGLARFELFVPESRSLKDKRQVLRSVTRSVQNKFNVSIAEVDFQDLWQRAALGVSCVSETGGQCRKVLQEVEKLVVRASVGRADIVERSVEVIAMEDVLS